MCIFLAMAIGCAVSESFVAFLTFRILHGAVASGMVLSRAIASEIFDKNGMARTMSRTNYSGIPDRKSLVWMVA